MGQGCIPRLRWQHNFCLAQIERDVRSEKAARKIQIVEFGATEMAQDCQDDRTSRPKKQQSHMIESSSQKEARAS